MAEDTGAGPRQRDPDAHAFVLRVWREDGAKRPGWRGHITHVASGTRRPILRLGEVGLFVGDYLVELGVVLPLVWRLRRLLGRPQR
jgi:hypothetical protein